MVTSFVPVHLLSERLIEAAAVLGRAAVDDPLFVYVLPDTAQRERGVPLLMQSVLRIGLTRGEVWTTPPPITGVASWISPAHPVVSQADREAAGFAEVRASWGPEAVARFYDVGADVAEAESLAPAEPHWYLHWLGIEPSAQGQGIGSTLVRQVFARADAEDVACQLLNFVPRNIPIYRHLGFRVILDTVLSRTGLRLWVMARPPLVSP
jgi:ribosomal protein S18 acetylase RimI-like enzyme